MQKSAQIKLVGTRQRTGAMQQHLRRQRQLRASRFECLEANRLLVGGIQQLRDLRTQRLGDFKARQLRDVLRLQFGLALLAFDRGERGLERVFGCGLVAATPLLVEIHRRAVQAHQQRRRLDRHWRTAIVFIGHGLKAKLFLGRHFPQKIEVKASGFGFGQRQKFSQRRALELEQHIGGLDFGALAVGGFDLIGSVVLGQHMADFEAAVFFVKNVQVNHFRAALAPA